MSQTAVPVADVGTPTGWSAPVWSQTDERKPGDPDFTVSSSATAADTFVVRLGNLYTPLDRSAGGTLTVRGLKTDAGPIRFLARLRQDTTTIAESYLTPGTGFSDLRFAIDADHLGLVTDFTRLTLTVTVVRVPTVTAVSPATGYLSGGVSVTVTGTGFTTAAAVAFGGVPASFVVDSDTSLRAVSPPRAAAGTVDVVVTNPTGSSATSAADQFVYASRTIAGTITGFAVGLSNRGVCAGPDGNLWVADHGGTGVWKVTPAGVATQHALAGNFHGICAGPDGNLWAADTNGYVWKITPAGSGTAYPLTVSNPYEICPGSDGNLWVTDNTYTAIWKVTPGGAAAARPLAGGARTYGICSAADANLWFVDRLGTPSVRQYLPVADHPGVRYALIGSNPRGICLGPDGNLWVADQNNAVWKVTTGGGVTPYSFAATLRAICAGPDGNLWAADDAGSGKLWQITPAGGPTAVGYVPGTHYALCVGPDGNLWGVADDAFVYRIS